MVEIISYANRATDTTLKGANAMMKKNQENQKSETLFREYRRLAENESQTYNDLKTAFPTSEFPKHAARFWRFSVLAEAWGSIATALSNNGGDFLDDWRTGK